MSTEASQVLVYNNGLVESTAHTVLALAALLPVLDLERRATCKTEPVS